MKTIWRYPIEFVNDPSAKEVELKIDMPSRSDVLYLRATCGFPKFWAMVETESPLVSRTFMAVRTGVENPRNSLYKGTFVKWEKIWHLFEVLD